MGVCSSYIGRRALTFVRPLHGILLALLKRGCHGPRKEVYEMLRVYTRPKATNYPANTHSHPLALSLDGECTSWPHFIKPRIVVIPYFAKWVEAEVVASIMVNEVRWFIWKNKIT